MKQLFAVFFSFYFLLGSAFPRGDFAQLMHIPDALFHFKEHLTEAKAESDSFSIWTFIRDHYNNPNSHTHDDDSNSHENLPLQHVHSSVAMIEAQYCLPPLDETTSYCSSEINFTRSLYSCNFKEGIYHPPIPAV